MHTLEPQMLSTPEFLLAELRKEFVRRKRANSAYSLRAFAQFLNINQSLLSKILNGQRTLSAVMREQLRLKLKLESNSDSVGYALVREDQFTLLADWYHFAILELLKTTTMKPAEKLATKPTEKWMARRLGLHIQEVRAALVRLERRGFIKREEEKYVLCSPNNTWTDLNATHIARQRLQGDLLKKSQDSLEQVPFAQREHCSLTVAVDARRLPEFKQKLNQVCRELDDYFQPAGEEFNEVYQLTVSFFPLTQVGEQREGQIINNELNDKEMV